MLTYKADILQMLKNAGYNTSRIRNEKLISENALQQIRNGEMIAVKTLEKICELLDAQPGDLIKYQNGTGKVTKNITLTIDFDIDFTPPLFFDDADNLDSACKDCPFYFFDEVNCDAYCFCPGKNGDEKCPIRKYFD